MARGEAEMMVTVIPQFLAHPGIDVAGPLPAELQTWIDIPEHPHVAACRFFRTVGDEIVIFAEYVDGGSLQAAIGERRLTRLDQLMDVAIQFARGLHAIHELYGINVADIVIRDLERRVRLRAAYRTTFDPEAADVV